MRIRRYVTALLVIGVVFVPVAHASFPGGNGRLAYVTDGAIYTLNTDGTDRALVATGTLPKWSPDGLKLVFIRSGDIYRANYDGTSEARLTTGANVDRPTWSPDGAKIAFIGPGTDGSDVFVMNADGSNPQPLAQPGYQQEPDWSPDGTRIAFRGPGRSGTDIWVMNADGTGATSLTLDPALDYDYESDTLPSWSPDGTRIAFQRLNTFGGENYATRIYTIAATGGPMTQIASGEDPSWSPDATRVAFSRGCQCRYGLPADLYLVPAAGGSETNVTATASVDERAPDWQPVQQNYADVSVIKSDDPDPVAALQPLTYTLLVENHGPLAAGTVHAVDNLPPDVAFKSATSTQGTCSRSGTTVDCAIGALNAGDWATVTIEVTPNARPSTESTINRASVSSGGPPDFDHGNNSDSEATTIVPTGFARPKGASPFNIALVPAFLRCANANRVHGPALSSPSCAPPEQWSQNLTVGTPDANGKPPNFAGRFVGTVLTDNPATGSDESDVQLAVSASDIRWQGALTDYAGQLQVSLALRITDQYSGGPLDEPATLGDIPPFLFPVPCAATASGDVGGTCSTNTTANAITPGIATKGKRAIWELGQVQVVDGGEDGSISTSADNTLFLKQGIFVP